MRNLFSPFPILETNRLILRQLSFKDEPFLFDYQSNKANFPHVNMPIYETLDDAKNYVIKMHSGVDENKWIVWAVCLPSDRIIGTVSIWNLNFIDESAELGYGLFPNFRRQGYMTEALFAVIHYGFKFMELKKLQAYTSHANTPSKALLESMNFQFKETISASQYANDLMDIYEIKRSY